MYDAVIVGARCAGAPLAMLLARAGHKALMVDRATFPSDTMSTHFVQSPGISRLKRWGLLDRVMATGCPPIGAANFNVSGEETFVEVPHEEGVEGVAAPRRHVLDKILVDAALEAGAELADGIAIDSLIFEDHRVVGVKGHSSDGAFEGRGRVVVGADGRHSLVAREVGASFVREEAPVSAGYYTYFEGIDSAVVETYFHEDKFCVTFPTNDGQTLVAVAWPHERFSEIKRDVEGNFMSALDSLGPIGERARASTRAERFVGTADVPNFLRKMHGPGWALVGDAGYHKDPAAADGITDAFRAADLLAAALDEVFKGADEESTMATYEERHAEDALPLMDMAIKCASFDNTPQQRLEGFIEARIHDAQEVEQLQEAPSLQP